MTQATHPKQHIIDRYQADLERGAVFARHAASNRSADHMGYNPVGNARGYGRMMAALGEYGQWSDRAAATAQAVAPALMLYGTAPQRIASVYDALGDVARNGYTDVVGRTGPNASRPSSYQHQTSLYDAIELALLGEELEAAAAGMDRASVGWCLAALARTHNVRPTGLRRVAAALAGDPATL
jgi:hypothetical protein